ncbi:hypothetical protein V5D56_08665 [Cellulosimicrobium sp. PMB13]|uniref:hypothetical protein n=1 Tax=Cellulosimicrobium sp. PMB13 TaxID=3120158 RepID=UPI003F4C3170
MARRSGHSGRRTARRGQYRLVGGIAITLLVHHHGAESLVPARETADADMGVALDVLGDDRLLNALLTIGYVQREGNRFVRDVDERRLVIDVLAPSYVGRLEPNQQTAAMVVDAVPGLLDALRVDAVVQPITAVLSDGATLEFEVALPDVRAALILKAYAYSGRFTARDATDVWRLLEAAHLAGHSAETWPRGSGGRDAAHALHQFFGVPSARGPDRSAQIVGSTLECGRWCNVWCRRNGPTRDPR